MPPALPTASAMCGDECTPLTPLSVLFTALPFIFTFAVISLTVLHRLFPQLCGASRSTTPRKRLSELAFSTTLGATGVLAELVLCEIGGWVDAGVRKLAFRAVIEVLLVCLVVAIPMLEMYSVVEGRWDARRRGVVVVLGFSAWLWVFWTLGDKLPIRSGEMGLWAQNSRSMREECIARVGVVGVSLMALLCRFPLFGRGWLGLMMGCSRIWMRFDAVDELCCEAAAGVRDRYCSGPGWP